MLDLQACKHRSEDTEERNAYGKRDLSVSLCAGISVSCLFPFLLSDTEGAVMKSARLN